MYVQCIDIYITYAHIHELHVCGSYVERSDLVQFHINTVIGVHNSRYNKLYLFAKL